jgi:hypothetical protein
VPHRSPSLPLVAALAGVAGLTSPASAQEVRGVPRILLDRGLVERPVRLISIDRSSVSYEEAGLVRTEPVTEHLALLPAPEAPQPSERSGRAAARPGAPRPAPAQELTSSPTRYLELTDGQLLTGALATDRAPGPESVRWQNPVVGAVELKLDEVSRVRLAGDGPGAILARSDAADQVMLINGDRLEGFVEGLGPVVRVSIGQQVRQVPADRVREVVLANPPVPAHGPVAHLRDGSILSVREIRTSRVGEVSLAASLLQASEDSENHVPGAATLPLADIRAYVFDASSLVALARLPIARQRPLGDRRWSPPAGPVAGPALLGAADIQVPGPGELEWAVPAGAVRLATTIQLPRAAWTWGDCRVSLSLAGPGGTMTLFSARVWSEEPAAAVNIALPSPGAGRTLRLTLEPGPYGSVQDRVTLLRPILMLEAPAK